MRGSRNPAAWAAATCATAYVVSKIDYGRQELIGIAGFPAPPESYDGFGDVAVAQYANAAAGLVTVIGALLLAVPMSRGILRTGIHVLSWIGVAMPAAGFVGFGARALQLTDRLGPAPTSWTAVATLAVGLTWAVSWAVAIVGHPEAGPRAGVMSVWPKSSPL